MKRGECPNCGTRLKWPALDVTLVEFDDDGKTRKELWCSPCRDALAPEQITLMNRCAFAQSASEKRAAMAAMRKMEKRIRKFIEARTA